MWYKLTAQTYVQFSNCPTNLDEIGVMYFAWYPDARVWKRTCRFVGREIEADEAYTAHHHFFHSRIHTGVWIAVMTGRTTL